MTTLYKTLLGAFTFLLITSGIAAAQDDADGFGFGDFPADETGFATDEANATDVDATAAPAKSDDSAPIIDPAVREVVLSDPKTADELLRAVDILLDLGRQDLAKDYLQKLTDLQLDKVELANLHRRVGSGVFVKLSARRDFSPQAADFARSVLVAATEMQQDPKRLAEMIDQLESADPRQHRRLARELINAGPVAVAPMLDYVANKPSSELAPLLRTSIAAIGKPAVGPLLAFLDCDNASRRAEAIRILGHMGTNRALPYLARSFSSSDDYERQSATNAIQKISRKSPLLAEIVALTQEFAKQSYKGRISIEIGEDGKSNAWIWSESANAPIRNRYLPRDIALFEAARHYETLYAIDASHHENRLRFLISGADARKVQAGLDVPLTANDKFIAAARAAESGFVSQAFEMAMADRHVPAMIGLAEALGHIGDVATLSGFEGSPGPLGTGLMHADSRVRFAAAMAVAKIGPQGSFAGNSRLVEALAHFGSSRGRRGALVAHPRAEVAQTIAGLLSQIGIEADIATTSKEALKHSTDSADYEFFLVSDAFDRPVTHQFVQLLRQNPLTASKPIGILARSAKHSDASMIEDLHPRVITLPETRDVKTIARAVARLEELSEQSAVSAERRGEMAYGALSELAALAKSEKLSGTDLTRFVHQIRRTSTTRGLAEKSIEVLGRSGSPQAQALLLEIANQHGLPISQRTKAAEAFAESAGQFGVMLTKRQIGTQYRVYNDSESLDVPTQQLLSSVLDSIEERLTN
ncbi:HEAT repeat domain-containing protein [Planctomycetota bacterium]